MDIPEVPTDGNIAVYAWIIWVLAAFVIVALPAIIIFYEKKLTKVSDRLNDVIDESIIRMEKKHETNQNGLTRINEIIVSLKEVVILAGRNER